LRWSVFEQIGDASRDHRALALVKVTTMPQGERDSRFYRDRAEELRVQAATMINNDRRANYLNLARLYEAQAEAQERVERDRTARSITAQRRR
jgi:hypothetical protein